MLLSFDDEQILIWRGHGWRSMYHGARISSIPTSESIANDPSCSGNVSGLRRGPEKTKV